MSIYQKAPIIFLSIISMIFLLSCSDEFVKGTYIASKSEYSLNFSSTELQNITSNGGIIKSRIEATNAVNWEIQGLPDWMSSTTLSGSGSQDVPFKVEENTSFTSSRTHIFYIITSNSDWQIKLPIAATQQKKEKFLTVSPSDDASLTFDSKGGQKILEIASNVSWLVECKESFVHLSQTSGQQSLNMSISVDSYENIDVTQNRTATVFFKDASSGDVLKILKITQTPLQTSIETETFNVDFDQNRNSKVYTLGKITGTYSVSSDAGWLGITKNSESGYVDVTITVEANENDDERTSQAYIHLDETNAIRYLFIVKQKGNSIEVVPSSLTFPASGASLSVVVNSSGKWKSVTLDDWIETQESGSSCRIIAQENNSLQSRSGIVKFNRLNEFNEIVGKTVSLGVYQEAKHINLDTQVLQFGPEAWTQKLSIDSDAPWTLTTNDDWITLSPTSGTGDANVNVSVTENKSTSSRSGTIILKCLGENTEIVVNQNTAYLNTISSPIIFDAKGGTETLSLSSNVHWDASCSASWLTMNPQSGYGDGVISLSAPKNNTGSERNGVISISSLAGTSKINVSQSAPNLTLSTYNVSFNENGGNETVIVTTDYDYEVTTSASWLTISKNGNTIRILAAKNLYESRTAEVVVKLLGISGTLQKTIKVSQKGDDTPYIDLGLPSGTRWCAYNKGATSVGGSGNTFTGSQSDSYNCPTEEQARELMTKCTWSISSINGTEGYLATGPNGKTLFFPKANVSLGGYSSNGMYVWIKHTNQQSDSQKYLTCAYDWDYYGPQIRIDLVAHRDQSAFSIREVR